MKYQLLALVASLGFFAIPSQVYAIEKCGSGKRVTCIVDGDTFWIAGEKVRAMGYDTPEPLTNLCGGAREQRLAERASQRLIELFNSTEITIERRGKDKYGRTLAVVRSNGRPVGDILVAAGLARHYPDGREFWCD